MCTSMGRRDGEKTRREINKSSRNWESQHLSGEQNLHREDGYFLSVSKAQSELTALEKAPVASYISTAG